MPELPEITAYIEGLERTVLGQRLEKVRLRSPSLLKSWDPPLASAEGRRVRSFRRLGKRVVWEMEGELFLVFHLMITGRYRWRAKGAKVPRKGGHAAFDFPNGSILLTEMGTKKRASLHLVAGERALANHDPGGVEPYGVKSNHSMIWQVNEIVDPERLLSAKSPSPLVPDIANGAINLLCNVFGAVAVALDEAVARLIKASRFLLYDQDIA